jgi:hypothetical protein
MGKNITDIFFLIFIFSLLGIVSFLNIVSAGTIANIRDQNQSLRDAYILLIFSGIITIVPAVIILFILFFYYREETKRFPFILIFISLVILFISTIMTATATALLRSTISPQKIENKIIKSAYNDAFLSTMLLLISFTIICLITIFSYRNLLLINKFK